MLYVSDIQRSAPAVWKTPLQRRAYQTLEQLHIPYERVDTDEAITMEDCVQIEEKLAVHMVKTLFLCNRQQTRLYLYITRGDKPFRSNEFGGALGVARVSFAPVDILETKLGTKVGAVTVFGVLQDKENEVQVVIDRDVLDTEWYGCSDGTTTGYMKVRTVHVIRDFLTYVRHTPIVIGMSS